MPTTPGDPGINYQEMTKGYGEQYRRGGPEVTRVCRVRWNEAAEFVWNILGWVEWESGANLIRHLPHALQSFENSHLQESMYADECRLVSCQGVPDIDEETQEIRFLDKISTDPIPLPGLEEFGFAIYEVVYRPRTYQLLNDDAAFSYEHERYVTRTKTYAATNITITGGNLRFVAAFNPAEPRLLPESLTKTLFLTEHTYVWHQIPADENGDLPSGLQKNISRMTGKCNQFDWLGTKEAPRFKAETLLCLASHEERYHDPHGNIVFDLTFKFLERTSEPDTGWNTTYQRIDPATLDTVKPGFYKIVYIDRVTLLYPVGNFDHLFVMEEQP